MLALEYALQLPSLNSSRNGSLGHQGADVDWILAGSGAGGSSARSMRVEDLESTSRQSSASLDSRRHLSAGKKAKLPWEDGQVRIKVKVLQVIILERESSVCSINMGYIIHNLRIS